MADDPPTRRSRFLSREFWVDPPAGWERPISEHYPRWLDRWLRRSSDRRTARLVRLVRPKQDGTVPLTIGQFYDAEPRRRLPGEMKFGDQWSTANEPGCDYAVFWVASTGELVAMRAPHGRPVMASRVVSVPHYDEPDFTVDVLAVLTAQQVDAVTEGWQQAMPTANSLTWLKDQIERAVPHR